MKVSVLVEISIDEGGREGWDKWREGDADRQLPLVLFALALSIIFLQFVFTILQFHNFTILQFYNFTMINYKFYNYFH